MYNIKDYTERIIFAKVSKNLAGYRCENNFFENNYIYTQAASRILKLLVVSHIMFEFPT